ncbi:MAG: GIY-YIG nuclease family protein [Prolixibacteraceae bacterium]|nr:GIY-YIG nuclease family protein [Prolixibacteraceae bacterium]
MKIDEGKCIYVLFNSITKYTKIGITDNIESRITSLENACGCPLELIYKTKHLICAEIYESNIHATLSEYRKKGEWFELPSPNHAVDIVEAAIKEATSDVLVENYKKGYSISSMAKEYQVSRQAILARLKKYGVYDAKGQIYEVTPNACKTAFITQLGKKDNKAHHISTVDESSDDTIYLDGEVPDLPLRNLKRIEPNINSNGEWYQVSMFKDGEFIYSYTRDINKARAYIQGVRAAEYADTTKPR